jgi:hypothetical protein
MFSLMGLEAFPGAATLLRGDIRRCIFLLQKICSISGQKIFSFEIGVLKSQDQVRII